MIVRIRRKLFGLHRREALFTRRGFAEAVADHQARLELVGATFIDGYNAWLADDLDAVLTQIPVERQGFAIEGAAMASALIDHLTPWRRGRWARLLRERPQHVYMIHVGAGWAIARLHGSLRRAIAERDPLLGWLVADGWGFHQAYFQPAQWGAGRRRIAARAGYVARGVDQGIGRALWFIAGADPARVAERIAGFAVDRHADLWSGVGLAAAYAGGCTASELASLVTRADLHHAQLAQGAAFAATARQRAGNPAPHCDAATIAITGRRAGELAQLAHALQPATPHDARGESYETWRTRIAEALSSPPHVRASVAGR